MREIRRTAQDGRTPTGRRSTFALLSRIRQRARRRPDHSRFEMDEQAFWATFQLELERSRRYDRSFSLTRLDLRGAQIDSAETVAALSDIRSGDAVATVDDRPLILWSETDDTGVDRALRRLVCGLPADAEVIARTVVFPHDGLSRAPLVKALDRVPARTMSARRAVTAAGDDSSS